MSTRLFNGTILTFNGSPVGGLVGLDYRVGGAWIEVTVPADVVKLFELPTQPDLQLNFKFRGCHALVNRAKGSMAITFSNGFTSTMPGTWQVGVFGFSADQDASWNSTAEARPTVPDA